jgi:hypothetical protein
MTAFFRLVNDEGETTSQVTVRPGEQFGLKVPEPAAIRHGPAEVDVEGPAGGERTITLPNGVAQVQTDFDRPGRYTLEQGGNRLSAIVEGEPVPGAESQPPVIPGPDAQYGRDPELVDGEYVTEPDTSEAERDPDVVAGAGAPEALQTGVDPEQLSPLGPISEADVDALKGDGLPVSMDGNGDGLGIGLGLLAALAAVAWVVFS